MKTGKRVWSALLALVLVFGMIVPVHAEDAVTVTGFSVEPVTMIEGADMSELSFDDGTGYMVYDIGVKNPMVAIELSDGTTTTCRWDEVYGFTGWNMGHPDGLQATSDWTASGSPYTWKVDLVDMENDGATVASTDVSVTIAPTPVESIVMEPVTMTQGVDTVLMTDPQGNEVAVYDFANICNPMFTVTFNDGREPLEASWWEMYSILGYSMGYGDDIFITADWEVGEHTFIVGLMGKTSEVTVTIVENPVAGVTATPGTLKQGVHSCEYEVWDETAEDWVYKSGYDIDATDAQITVSLKDGTSVTGTILELAEQGYEFRCDWEARLDTVNWEEGKTYEIPAELDGNEFTLKITLEPDPIESITVEDLTFREVLDRIREYTEDGEIFVFDLFNSDAQITVTYTDGTVVTGTAGEMEELVDSWVNYDYEEYIATADWEAGKTYTYTFTLLGRDVEAKAHVVANPVAAVEAAPIELKYSDWETGWHEQGGEFRYYNYYQYLELEITYNDGTTEVATFFDLLNDGYDVDITDEQGPGAEWEPGEHEAAFVGLGHEVPIAVTIVDNRVTEISAKAQRPLYEDLSAEVDFIELVGPLITVTYGDGRTETFDLYDIWEHLGNAEWNIALAEETDAETLTAGEHDVVLTVNGVSCEFPITVLENPIKSFRVIPEAPFTENVHGYEDIYVDEAGNEVTYFVYEYGSVPFTVELTMKDGTVNTYRDLEEIYDLYHSPYYYPSIEQGPGDIPGPGTYTVTVSMLGMEAEHTVSVVASNVSSITGSYNGKLLEGVDGWWNSVETEDGWEEVFVYSPNSDSFIFTVTYTDGTSQTVGMEDELMGTYVRNLVNLRYDQFEEMDWVVGKNKVTVSMLGFEIPIEIELVENTYEKLTISNDNGMTVVMEKADGTKDTFAVQNIVVHDVWENGTYVNADLETGNGVLNVQFTMENGSSQNIKAMYYAGLRSNALTGCVMLDKAMTLRSDCDISVAVDKNQEELQKLIPEEIGKVNWAWLDVTDLTGFLSYKDEKLLKAELAKHAGLTMDTALSISLYAQTRSEWRDISEAAGPMTITLGLSEELKGFAIAGIKILHTHDGAVEMHDATLNRNAWTVSFEVDHFSTFAIAYTTHNLTKVDAKDATCTEAGNTAYYTCSHCDKLFADDKAATETTKEAVVVAAAGHKLTKVDAKAATCTEAGNTAYWTCGTCKKLFADAEGKTEITAEKTVVAAAGHKLTKVEAKAATVEAEGCKEHYKCDTCGALFADAEGETAVKAADLVIAKLSKPADGSNPQTGDTAPVGMLMLLAIVSGMLLVGECLFGKKRFR